MRSLPEWGDDDLRDDALIRVAQAVQRARPRETLTARERDVLRCLSHGLGYMGTADTLQISLETVKVHAKKARRILRAKDSTHACCEAVRQGLIT